MKINIHARHDRMLRQTFFVMKITAFLLLISIMTVSAATNAQQITLKTNHATLEEVFDKIHQQTGYDVFYSNDQLAKAKTVTVNLQNTNLKDALNQILADQPLDYRIEDQSVIISAKKPSLLSQLKDKLEGLIANIDVHGRVVGEDGQPLSGATVQVKNGNNVTATDADGYFTLKNADPASMLIVSFIGFDKLEVKAASELGTIKLIVSQSKLDEVKVIAYGQTTERLSVGSVSTVSAKTIGEQPVQNPLLALEGQVPGLFITQANGVPGSGVTVRIQGINSINGGNDPLYVIDGVPYVSQMLPTTTGGTAPGILGGSGSSYIQPGGSGNPMSYINPSDIESISVLKDADATAIYGSRAANGAILITTKQGKIGRMTVSVEAQEGWGEITRSLDMMNTQQYLQMRNEAIKNDKLSQSSAANYDLRLWDTTRYTNWEKVLIGNTAHYNNLTGSVSGGTDNVQYLVSGTFNRQTSVFPGDFADERGGLHFNLNTNSDNHKFRFQLTGSYLTDHNLLPTVDLTYTALTTAPDAPPLYNPDGSINWALNASGTSTWAGGNNPMAAYTLATYQNTTNNLIASSLISYKLLPNLEIRVNLGYNNLQTNELQLNPLTALQPAYRAFIPNSAAYTNSTIGTWNVEPQLNYNVSVGKGKISLLLGSTIEQNNSNGYAETGSGYTSDALLSDIHSASSLVSNSSVQSVYRYNALFGRLNYNWDDKYLLDITARRDGSSRFGDQNQFHDFGSVGAGWIFNKENFFKNLSVLSYGKIRGSYGTTGNDQIGNYQFLNLYNTSSVAVPYQGIQGLTTNYLPNPYIQWEVTRKLQFGIDLGFFNDRLLLTSNYVYNRSSNQLLGYSLPIITGFSDITANFPATVQNTAVELELNSVNVKSKEFTWTSAFNLTLPENKLVAFPNLATSSYANALIVGQPITVRKVYHFLGVDPATGVYEFADANGKPTTNSPALASTVNTAPKFYGGLSNSFSYKGFRLDLFFQFVKQIGQNDQFGFSLPGYTRVNEPVSVLARWQTPGQVTDIERYNSTRSLAANYGYAANSDAGYSDASYIRLKNLSLSYNLPEKYLKNIKMQNIQVFIQGQNLLTITKFQGMDPENQLNVALPPLKLLTLGLKAGF